MKMLFSISLLSILLLALFMSAPRPAHADSWVDDLISCTGGYLDGQQSAWNTWDQSGHTSGDQNARDNALDTAFNNYQACNSVVNIPYAAIEYCQDAYGQYMSCANQFQGWDNTAARMECQLATGFDGHCQ
jgi:hypothetical protein